MSGHTPGEWMAGSHGYGNVKGPGTSKKFRRVRSGDVEVARVWCGIADDETRDSNPHDLMLILAAPELLAAARLANKELMYLGAGSSGSPALVALWSAIAKAEGG